MLAKVYDCIMVTNMCAESLRKSSKLMGGITSIAPFLTPTLAWSPNEDQVTLPGILHQTHRRGKRQAPGRQDIKETWR